MQETLEKKLLLSLFCTRNTTVYDIKSTYVKTFFTFSLFCYALTAYLVSSRACLFCLIYICSGHCFGHLACKFLYHNESDLSVTVYGPQMHKLTSISLQMVEIVILSEKSCHFVSYSACNNICFLLRLR